MPRYIDAEKLKHLVNEKNYNAINKHFFFDCITECDTEDVAPVVHGKWIERWHENKHVIGDMACSVCGTQMLLDFPKFCPFCGAKMDGDENETNCSKS